LEGKVIGPIKRDRSMSDDCLGSGYKGSNLGFRTLTISIGNPVILSGPCAILAITRWVDAPGGAMVSTIGAKYPDTGITLPPSVLVTILPGLTKEAEVLRNLIAGIGYFDLIKGGYDVEVEWLPAGFKLEVSGGLTPLDKWTFLVVYPKNELKW